MPQQLKTFIPALFLAIAAPVSAATFTVNTVADEFDTPSGASLSLREAVRDANAAVGANTIEFAAALSGSIIALAAGEITFTGADPITVDASALVGGLTVDGAGATRLFLLASGTTVTLRKITLTGGNGTSPTASGQGGAMLSDGALTLEDCKFTGNSAPGDGGAIQNLAGNSLTVTRCVFTGNAATGVGSLGGAISSAGALTITFCTFSANTAPQGGAIRSSDGALAVSQSTLTGNSAAIGGALSFAGTGVASFTHLTITANDATGSGGVGGGGIQSGKPWTLTNSLVAGNTAAAGGADIENQDALTYLGTNLVQSLANSGIIAGFASGPAPLAGTPLLAPLDNYGGPTPTMALLPGSPALNAAIGSTILSDQRGFPIVGPPDLGAYEAGTATSYNAWVWETLPATATGAQHAATFDFDGDGPTNGSEWVARTDPGDFKNFLRITEAVPSGPYLKISFPTVIGRIYAVESSPDFATWTLSIARYLGDGLPRSVDIGPIAEFPKYFFRVRVIP